MPAQEIPPSFEVGDCVSNRNDRRVVWVGGHFTAAPGFPWVVVHVDPDPRDGFKVHWYDLEAKGQPAMTIRLKESELYLVEKAGKKAEASK